MAQHQVYGRAEQLASSSGRNQLVRETSPHYVAKMSMYPKDGSPRPLQDHELQDHGHEAVDAKVRRLHDDQSEFAELRGSRRRRGIRAVPLRIIVPNLVTLLALCMGLTAIRFAIDGQYETAVVAVIAAAILDGLDGRIARVLRGTSRFGAELDFLPISSISGSRQRSFCIFGPSTK